MEALLDLLHLTIPHISSLIPFHVLLEANKLTDFLDNEVISNPSKPLESASIDISDLPLQLTYNSLPHSNFNHPN
jgi:hypothetical protein